MSMRCLYVAIIIGLMAVSPAKAQKYLKLRWLCQVKKIVHLIETDSGACWFFVVFGALNTIQPVLFNSPIRAFQNSPRWLQNPWSHQASYSWTIQFFYRSRLIKMCQYKSIICFKINLNDYLSQLHAGPPPMEWRWWRWSCWPCPSAGRGVAIWWGEFRGKSKSL
jgi:hypothetical protein